MTPALILSDHISRSSFLILSLTMTIVPSGPILEQGISKYKRRKHEINIITIVSVSQIEGKLARSSMEEFLVNKSMSLPLDDSWPERLKEERDYRLVTSYRAGHGHKYPGKFTSPEDLHQPKNEFDRDVRFAALYYDKEWYRYGLTCHKVSFYSLDKDWPQEMITDRDSNLVAAFKLFQEDPGHDQRACQLSETDLFTKCLYDHDDQGDERFWREIERLNAEHQNEGDNLFPRQPLRCHDSGSFSTKNKYFYPYPSLLDDPFITNLYITFLQQIRREFYQRRYFKSWGTSFWKVLKDGRYQFLNYYDGRDSGKSRTKRRRHE